MATYLSETDLILPVFTSHVPSLNPTKIQTDLSKLQSDFCKTTTKLIRKSFPRDFDSGLLQKRRGMPNVFVVKNERRNENYHVNKREAKQIDKESVSARKEITIDI